MLCFVPINLCLYYQSERKDTKSDIKLLYKKNPNKTQRLFHCFSQDTKNNQTWTH